MRPTLPGMTADLTLADPDELARASWVKILKNHGFSNIKVAAATMDTALVLLDGQNVALEHFVKPVRAGAVLERLRYHSARQRTRQEPVILGSWTFDSATRSLSGRTTLRLTDKESEILECLLQANPRAISRQALLDAVWGYADGVETHTLETHIYRLRQKIEADPSRPAIILTDGDGYKLA